MGRPREFDAEEALDAALSVFWMKGYEGTSLDDLTAATGVARPGLYREFGNKEAFFYKAFARYNAKYMTYIDEALRKSTAIEVVRHMLEGAIEVQTMDPAHPGCMGTNAALACSAESEPIQQEVIRRRLECENTLRKRLEKARNNGDLPRSADCRALAGYVMTVTHGMAVQAKSGASKALLQAIANQALTTWPSSKRTEK